MPSFFSIEMGVSLTFCLGWPQTVILPISASYIARIIDLSYCTWPFLLFSYFSDRVFWFLFGWASDCFVLLVPPSSCKLPCLACLLDGGLTNSPHSFSPLPWVTSNCDSPNLCLPRSWHYRSKPLYPALVHRFWVSCSSICLVFYFVAVPLVTCPDHCQIWCNETYPSLFFLFCNWGLILRSSIHLELSFFFFNMVKIRAHLYFFVYGHKFPSTNFGRLSFP
jgi:hypothetical protein